MSIKALSPLFALTCLSGLALAFGCSDPPAAETPPAQGGTSTTGGSSTPGAGTSNPTAGATPGGGQAPTAGSAGTPAAGGGGAGGGGGGTPAGGTAGAGPDAPAVPGFTNVINENFNGPIDLDHDPIWTWSDGGLSEGQVRYTKEAITFADGHMKITVSKPAAPVAPSPSFAENTGGTNLKAYPLMSGEFRTKHNNYRYGRYEASIKAPMPNPANAAGGNFINTLFIFRTPKIEDWREIDIEITGGSAGQLMTNMVHGQGVGDYGQTMNKAVQTPNIPVPQGFNTMSGFHTYAFEWRSDSITWFVDGTQVRKETGAGSPPIPTMSAKIMMSVWVFDASYNFGGPDGEQNMYPFTAEYDWFRFYKLDGETYPMDPAALPATDLNKSKNNATETDTQG